MNKQFLTTKFFLLLQEIQKGIDIDAQVLEKVVQPSIWLTAGSLREYVP